MLRSHVLSLSSEDLVSEIAQSLYEEAIATMQSLIAMPEKQSLKKLDRIRKLRTSPRIADRLVPLLYNQYIDRKRHE